MFGSSAGSAAGRTVKMTVGVGAPRCGKLWFHIHSAAARRAVCVSGIAGEMDARSRRAGRDIRDHHRLGRDRVNDLKQHDVELIAPLAG